MHTVVSNTKVFFCRQIREELSAELKNNSYSSVFVLCDDNTREHCLPLIDSDKFKIHCIPHGEAGKSFATLHGILDFLIANKADRDSVLINIGGGVICDLGGFAASIFKRGIDFINVPTTLLAQVDAAVGGKTGINYGGLKNEIGLFSNPAAVFFDTEFLKTLSRDLFLSGFAEMLKHALIFDKQHWTELCEFDILNPDHSKLRSLVKRSVEIKNYFILNDPKEKNIRKALNFGHTIGHAIESFMMDADNCISHGAAVAIGIAVESSISMKMMKLSDVSCKSVIDKISSLYNCKILTDSSIDSVLKFMRHDKKNKRDSINFTLLNEIGAYSINNYCSEELIQGELRNVCLIRS